MYYALYDKQTNRYIAAGFNATSWAELAKAYHGYMAIDLVKSDQGDAHMAKVLLKGLNVTLIRYFIESNEFDIRESLTKFTDDLR